MILESISNLHEEGTHQTKKSNINCPERKALESLNNNEHIIIKQADKGGATVIMVKQYYKERILEMLSDREAYAELKENEDKKIMKKNNHLTKQYQQELTKKEINYLQNFAPRTSNLYGLPRIHKSQGNASAINKQRSTYIKVLPPTDLPFRPIVAGPTCPTHRLSNFIDILLKPLCKHIPSYSRDDLDILNHIPNEVEETTILVTFDVVSLYTSIPHDLGLDAIKFWLEHHQASLPREFSTEFILDAISIILQENTFQFDDKQFKQLQGTAMGDQSGSDICDSSHGISRK